MLIHPRCVACQGSAMHNGVARHRWPGPYPNESPNYPPQDGSTGNVYSPVPSESYSYGYGVSTPLGPMPPEVPYPTDEGSFLDYGIGKWPYCRRPVSNGGPAGAHAYGNGNGNSNEHGFADVGHWGQGVWGSHLHVCDVTYEVEVKVKKEGEQHKKCARKHKEVRRIIADVNATIQPGVCVCVCVCVCMCVSQGKQG